MSTASTGLNRLSIAKQTLRGGVGGGNPFAALQTARPEPQLGETDDHEPVDSVTQFERTATDVMDPVVLPAAVVPPTVTQVETVTERKPAKQRNRFLRRYYEVLDTLYVHRKAIAQGVLLTAILAVVSIGYYLGIVSLAAIATGWFCVVFAGRLIQQAVMRSAFLAYDAGGRFRPSRAIVIKSLTVALLMTLMMSTTGEVWQGLLTGAVTWLYADRLLTPYLAESAKVAKHRLEGWQHLVAG